MYSGRTPGGGEVSMLILELDEADEVVLVTSWDEEAAIVTSAIATSLKGESTIVTSND